LLFVLSPVRADELDIVVRGVEGPVLENVRNRVQAFRIAGNAKLSRRALEKAKEDGERRARSAMRPFGYYHPVIEAGLVSRGDRAWTLEIDIEPGPPVVISKIEVDLRGDGADVQALKDWRRVFPLRAGQVLVQPTWDEQKRNALALAEDNGYLLAEYSTQRMDIDLEKNQAELELVLNTGEQAVMGRVLFNQDIVRPAIMDNMPRFKPGDPYNAYIQEKFRIDLWQAGYFGQIEVLEERHLDVSPPRVDLVVNLEPRKRNTYQGAVGIGSDTGPRANFSWTRHLLSRRGDSFRLDAGWQRHNNEALLRGNYRIPRRNRSKQFWTAEGLVRRQTEDVKVRENDSGDDFFTLGKADINDYSIRAGRLKIRDRKHGFEQLFETVYAQLVREKTSFRLDPASQQSLQPFLNDAEGNAAVERSHTSVALGVEWSLPVVRGSGWELVGHNHRFNLFTANEAWGSESDFTQAYASTRWNVMLGDDWKLLARGEIGYSDADVDEIDIVVDDQPIRLSVTDLPNLYRFKAGGSTSVRGYNFESLNNNGIGSNNIVTASLELERKIFRNWSAAAFFDLGNAFNDWDEADLKKGVGVGVRWYTIAGAMRVDFAKALDIDGEPWRIHFTIGTSLL
jgi:translocation and assembly module TamA